MKLFFIIFLMSTHNVFPNHNKSKNIHFNFDVLNTETMIIKKYTDYNLWSNQQLVTWLENIPESLFDKEIESSFPSIKQTVEHIWNAEVGWLNHIKDLPWGEAPSKNFLGSPKEILNQWLNASQAFNIHVQTMTEQQLSGTKTNTSGTGSTSYIEMIHHCMNHSTYHRGQLITLGRQLGLKNPPRTDFIYYLRLK